MLHVFRWQNLRKMYPRYLILTQSRENVFHRIHTKKWIYLRPSEIVTILGTFWTNALKHRKYAPKKCSTSYFIVSPECMMYTIVWLYTREYNLFRIFFRKCCMNNIEIQAMTFMTYKLLYLLNVWRTQESTYIYSVYFIVSDECMTCDR